MRACAAFTQVYGNLQEQSVKEILTGSSVLKEWRSAIVADYTDCGKYEYCNYCSLCAGINYSEHKDFHKPAESNCYLAKCRFNLAHKLMEHEEPMSREQFVKALQKLPVETLELKRVYRKG